MKIVAGFLALAFGQVSMDKNATTPTMKGKIIQLYPIITVSRREQSQVQEIVVRRADNDHHYDHNNYISDNNVNYEVDYDYNDH